MAAARLIDDFMLPSALEAGEPPEARGISRDHVRMLVSDVVNDSIEHARFDDLPRWLSRGDLLVVNTSGTLNAALPATADLGHAFELHLSTRLPGGFWTIEVRSPTPAGSLPFRDARAGTRFELPAGGRATLLAPYPSPDIPAPPSRLWISVLQTPGPLIDYLDRHGSPIRYNYVKQAWPSSIYQTVFATKPGSAEMPSAGRPFTPQLVTRLVSQGIQFATLLLHTGVSSLEHPEPPYEEFYRVPLDTAERVNATMRARRRVIAVGTTVVRALETVTDDRGLVHPGEGWTSLVIAGDRRLRSVNGLITGFHEPKASHLALLERVVAASAERRSANGPFSAAVCGHDQLQRAYTEAREAGYLWHEFGDSHLILGK